MPTRCLFLLLSHRVCNERTISPRISYQLRHYPVKTCTTSEVFAHTLGAYECFKNLNEKKDLNELSVQVFLCFIVSDGDRTFMVHLKLVICSLGLSQDKYLKKMDHS